MKRKIGAFLMITGAVLILAALSLAAYNRWEADQALKASEEILEQLEEILAQAEQNPKHPAVDTEDPSAKGAESEDETERQMTVVNIDGHDYVGYISIATLGLALPVMAEWSYDGLKISPGRYAGTTFNNDLVICAHNYSRHFSPIKWIDPGTEVVFKDMDGYLWTYEVLKRETVQPTAVSQMIGKEPGKDWDLTLFTCNTGGQTRCAVRCVLKKEAEKE